MPSTEPGSRIFRPVPPMPPAFASSGGPPATARLAGCDYCVVSGRLTSRHFVGRRTELAELELAFRDAADGHPGLVLLGGDSGVGKTRLVLELERAASDALLLRGECLERGDGELPYAPLLGALRPLVRERDPALSQLSSASRAHLAELVPSLAEDGGAPRSAGPGGESAGQARMFEALLELLHTLSERAPVLLTFEDMHWADRSTRAFSSFLARSVRDERLLLVLTYRADELHRRHPLRPLLADLDRLDRSRRLELLPFDRAELAEALTDILGRQPDQALVERLLERSDGNPLFVEELLAAGLDGRGAASQSLRDAFMLRVERLSGDARSVLRALAVGQRLDEATLGTLTGIGGDRLHAALREAVAEQVLVPGADGRLGFRHALLREAVYDDLLPGERGELHLALARELERTCREDADAEVDRSSMVAAHYAAAGEQTAALRATVAAARVARRVHAWGEVAEAADRALELWPRVAPDARPEALDHVELLILAARAHGIVGDGGMGEQLMQRALAELDPDREPVRYGAVLARLVRVQWRLGRGRDALATAERAQALLAGDGAVQERAPLLSWIARTRVLRGRFREAIADGEEALAAAQALDDPALVGEVLNTLGMARCALGDVDAGTAQLREAIDLARSADDLDGVAYAYSNLADMLNLAGRTAEALEVAREGLARTPPRMRRACDWLSLTVSELALEAGNWPLAREHLGPPPARLEGTTLIFRQIRDAELALGEGDEAAAETALAAIEPLVRASNEPQWHGAFGSLLGELRRRQGDLDGARGAVARALDELEVCTDDVMRIARVSAVGMAIEADQALRARDLRAQAAAKDARTRARIHFDRLEAAAAEGGPVERAFRAVGAAELARARARNDPRRWAAAAAAWEALGRPYRAGVARWRQGESLVEAGDRAAAAEIVATALGSMRRLGAGWLAGELEALAARGRLELAPRATAATESNGAHATAAGGHETPFGLTERELQVLALVASGATNRQIGQALYMAEKTASVHVSRILRKLGAASRTEAAAIAHRQHLA